MLGPSGINIVMIFCPTPGQFISISDFLCTEQLSHPHINYPYRIFCLFVRCLCPSNNGR